MENNGPKPVCLVLHPDKELCREIGAGIARCVSDCFTYRFTHSVEQAMALHQTLLTEGLLVKLLIVDQPATYRALTTAAPVFEPLPYGYLDSQKDAFYADITNLRSRMRLNPEVEDFDTWDKTRFLACLERSLDPAADRYHGLSHTDETDEVSPLAGLNTDLERQIDPATLVGTSPHSNGKASATIRQISTAISEIQLRRDRRREVQIPLTDTTS